jgi:hypothetical protein
MESDYPPILNSVRLSPSRRFFVHRALRLNRRDFNTTTVVEPSRLCRGSGSQSTLVLQTRIVWDSVVFRLLRRRDGFPPSPADDRDGRATKSKPLESRAGPRVRPQEFEKILKTLAFQRSVGYTMGCDSYVRKVVIIAPRDDIFRNNVDLGPAEVSIHPNVCPMCDITRSDDDYFRPKR